MSPAQRAPSSTELASTAAAGKNHQTGATYGDDGLALIAFAENHPAVFILTVPLTLLAVLLLAIFVIRVGLFNPVGKLKEAYDAERKNEPKPTEKDPELPL